jgi:hypothetical protein
MRPCPRLHLGAAFAVSQQVYRFLALSPVGAALEDDGRGFDFSGRRTQRTPSMRADAILGVGQRSKRLVVFRRGIGARQPGPRLEHDGHVDSHGAERSSGSYAFNVNAVDGGSGSMGSAMASLTVMSSLDVTTSASATSGTPAHCPRRDPRIRTSPPSSGTLRTVPGRLVQR